ncbi:MULTISPECIES: DUF3397 domain-containing protein [Heyndrickxia]|jgi:hypothetical protein|uniref:Uncharacterized protein n=1 Tax=Heyndrickxia oleronia TaxID=38875 RepID=A0A8E2LFJ9_9BACI|nr:DUF3397 domain-containing protein [Heyndrickxia oleronia]NYV67469.1 DUF3397 domain-containing protein [Bacillus sp. Gen3]OJH17951.1 hypothetical protein BLX88_15625 [Bacillus obstructivus]MBU5210960.1 DUF3397 domain-containing protein [Heyndrickxia oleronia]MCI1611528.1 DUF3397 domain-containing protein [Heyndrickxia oleronia]MCI1760050.1 DUF3397 domain-containing protein [Heyndrickxia oleronia]
MGAFLSSFISIFIMLPFLGYFLSFILVKQLTRNHRRAVSIAIDITTLILIISVHFLIKGIWGQSLLWLIMLIILMIGLVFVVFYRSVRDEIEYSRVFKGFWRLNFLFFTTIYIILFVYGMTSRILDSVMS